MKKHIKPNLILIVFLLSFIQASPVQARTYLKNMRHWTAPDHTRIVLDLDKPPKYKLSSDGNSRHIIVELTNTRSKLRYKSLKILDGLIKTLRVKAKDKKTLGIVIELMIPAKADVFTLKKFRNKPDRLVIDVIKPFKKTLRQRKIKSATKAKQKGDRIVLIDPGHGGEDPGAIGRRLKLKEKKVALSIAKRLHYLLKKEPGITPYLTRTGDYYLSLKKRTQLAEKYQADLMISIHTNANNSPKVRGSSVYYLSPKGASDKASKLLAQKENAADLIGGTPMSEDKTLNAILIDMMQTSSVNDSIKLAKATLKSLKGLPKVPVDKKLHSAPFAVLKSPATPSILVEVAFISNPKEERKLADPKFHKKVAQQLALAVKNYLKQTNGDKASPKKKNKNKKKKRLHVVKKGETIWRIARKYRINLQKLRKANKMGRSNFIRVGQKLHIP